MIGYAALIYLILAAGYSKYFPKSGLEYTYLVLSGNWPSDKPDYVSCFVHLMSGTLAVGLNVLTIIAVVLAAWKLISERSEVMQVAHAFALKDTRTQAELLRRLSDLLHLDPEAKLRVENSINQTFQDCSRDWAMRTLPRYMDGEELRNFVNEYYEPQRAAMEPVRNDLQARMR